MTLSKHLYEFAQIMAQIEENNGEISSDLLPVLSNIELSIADKIDNYVNFYDVVKGQIERTKKNIEHNKSQLQTLENLETRLKENVKHTMSAHSLLTLEGTTRGIKLVNVGGGQSTCKPEDMFFQQECVNPKYILDLDKYVEEKIVYVIKDKEKFKEAIKNNEISNCFLLPRGKYVKFI